MERAFRCLIGLLRLLDRVLKNSEDSILHRTADGYLLSASAYPHAFQALLLPIRVVLFQCLAAVPRAARYSLRTPYSVDLVLPLPCLEQVLISLWH